MKRFQAIPKYFSLRKLSRQHLRPAVYLTAFLSISYTVAKVHPESIWVYTSNEKNESNRHPVEGRLSAIKHYFLNLIYRWLPWRTVSRTWGKVCSIENIPSATKLAILRWYVNKYEVDLSEAERENIEDYACLSDLFRRKLKKSAREIDPIAALVSPSDGKIMVIGEVSSTDESLQQVKGTSFSLRKFLGEPTWNNNEVNSTANPDHESFISKIKKFSSTETSLQYIVIYLSPGDYHRFHSPTNWKVLFRRHFSGELLSVKPAILAYVNELFSINERVVYIGEWTHGFMSMTPVGATNVGSIIVYEDPDLITNVRKHQHGSSPDSEYYFKVPQKFHKGEMIGEFNLGSTIVLIFECPKNMEFAVNAGDKIKVGNALLTKKI